MPVKRSHSGSRILGVLEAIAGHQPIGVRALARLLNQDKSAIQRALATLADEGWIRTTREPPVRWEVTAHILAVASIAQGSNDLRRRARPLMEQLRDDTGETVLLVVPDFQKFVIADVVESRQVLRMVPNLGILVGVRNTATGRAVLPYMDLAKQISLLGAEPDRALMESFEMTRKIGYAISEGEINPAATTIATPIFEFDGSPAGAIVVTGPGERFSASRRKTIGKMMVLAARELSRASPTRQNRQA